MSFPFDASKWPQVGALIDLFVAMGCELHTLPRKLEGPDGSLEVRFLYNPETDEFVSLNGYADDERVPPSEVEAWERRLGMQVPRKPDWQ